MEKKVVRRTLPSCRVSRSLIRQLENYLLIQIPKILKDDVKRMVTVMGKRPEELRRYSLSVLEGQDVKEYASIGKYPDKTFSPKTRRATLRYQLGIPVTIEVAVRFAHREAPVVEVSTVHQGGRKLCTHVCDNIRGIIQNWSNKNGVVHNRGVQVATAVSLPVAVVVYGWFTGADLFFLVASQGWLFLLGIFLIFNLKRLFPLVAFETGRRRFNLRTLLYSAGLAGIVSLIVAYIVLLNFELAFTP